MRRYAEILVLASTATLFFRKEVFYLFKPFEIGVAASLLCLLIYALRRRENPLKGTPSLQLWLTLFGLMLFWSAVGTVNGYRIYGIADPVKTAGGFFYLGVGMAAFLLALHYGERPAFRNAMYACLLSPLLLTPLLLMPAKAEAWEFVADKIHFFGFHKNPTTFAFLAAIACVILIGKCLAAKSKAGMVLPWLGTVALFALCLWTGSRAAWLAIAIAYAWMAFLTYRSARLRLGKLPLLAAAAALTIAASFTLLPHRTKIMALDRIYPQISGNVPAYELFAAIPWQAVSAAVTESRPSLPYQSRQSLWPQSLALFAEHPLGLGVEYFRSAKAIRQDGYSTHSHNTALQILLTGGAGLLATCLLFAYAVALKLWEAEKGHERTVLSALLVATAVFLMIGEYFYIVPWTWILAGLAAATSSARARNGRSTGAPSIPTRKAP